MQPTTSYISVTDQFCGAGGSSLGAAAAGCEIVLAMNHWQLAIDTHNTNFPDTTHVLADISLCDPKRYPTTDILITSPECTNHSLAKGVERRNQGQLSLFGEKAVDPAEERSRATMWDVVRFAEYHNYRIIIVENVVDARRWRLFDAWLHAMQVLGYDFEMVYFNSMFAHPTPQSRDRMYVVFWKRGNKKPDLNIKPDAYCPKCEQQIQAVQSWKKDRHWGTYKRQYVYRCPQCAGEVNPLYYPAWTAIDWALPVERIGDRDRPLKERTIERIKYGLEKFGRSLLVPMDHTRSQEVHARPVDKPYPTQMTWQTLGLAVDPFLVHYYTRSGAYSSVHEEMPTVSTANRFGLVMPPFFAELYGTSKVRDVDQPMGAVLTVGHHGLVLPPFLTSVNHSNDRARSVDNAMPTQMTSTSPALVYPPFLTSYYGNDMAHSLDEAMGTLTTVDRHALIEPGQELKVEDCGFRMIQPHEIQAAMAFPGTYQVLGTKRDKVRQLGNAVTPPVMNMLVNRCVEALK